MPKATLSATLYVALLLPLFAAAEPLSSGKRLSPQPVSALAAYRSMWFSLNIYYVNSTDGAPSFDASRHRYPVTSMVYDVGQIVSSVTAAHRGDSAVRFLLEALSYRIADAALSELIFAELSRRARVTKRVAGQLGPLDRTPCASELSASLDLLDATPEAYCVSLEAWRESLRLVSGSLLPTASTR